MSIKGFKFGDGEVQKYDYEALDNLPESFVEIDDTLTEEGKAADAKKTGDEIVDLKSALHQLDGIVGDTPMGTSADTITGAVAEHEGDISALDTGLSAEASRAATAENLKVNKPVTSPNGVSGQLLRTNGDGTTAWVDEGLPTDEQTAEAVSAWLDNHPEATTTVEDGSVTIPKLAQTTKDLIVIEEETEKSGFHNVSPVRVNFYPDNRLTNVTAKYTTTKNLVDDIYQIGISNGITRTRVGKLLNLTGTGTNQLFIFNTTNETILSRLAGKTINLYVFIKKATSWGNSSHYALYVDNSRKVRANFTSGGTENIGWNEHKNIEIPDNVNQLIFKFDSLNGSTFEEGDCIWVGIYESELVDTEHAITGNDPYTTVVQGLNSIDTATHESTAVYYMKTKTYVEEHTPDIIGYWNNRIYALPEDFGAVGDGVVDDGTALGNCIQYAAITGKPIRGYGKYKTSSAIILGTRYLDVYLREVIYTGNGSAIEFQERNIILEFHRIVSNNIGINFTHNNDASPKNASYCKVNGNEINSVGDCISCQEKTLYNTVEVRYLSSSNGNCITSVQTGQGFPAGEYIFKGSSCHCPNGYVAENMSVSKFYDFTVEKDCKFGYLNPLACMCIGCRHREQTDGMKIRIIDEDPDYNNGALIIFTQPVGTGAYGFKYFSWDPIPYYSIDLSAIQGYDELQDAVSWRQLAYTGIDLGSPICGFDETRRTVIGNKLYFIGNNKVYAPEQRQIVIIETNTYDYTVFDESIKEKMIASNSLYYGTDFIVSTNHTDIYFNASFGAVGYNDLTLTQENGNTATIYDKLGNVIFDGTNEGDGKWNLKCFIDRSSFGRYQGTTNRWCYDGTNEFWEVKKLS